MKPQNRFQKQVVEAGKTLPDITNAQIKWAYQNCICHIARITKKGVITCLDCGHAWHALKRKDKFTTCPVCNANLNIKNTRKRKFEQNEYLCTMTTNSGFQVLRFYYVSACFITGKQAQYRISEVVQRWIAPNGRQAVLAKSKSTIFYTEHWNFCSPLEIRRDKTEYNIYPTRMYPPQHILPELKKRGYRGACHGIAPFSLCCALLTDSQAETLFKAGRTDALKYFIKRGLHDIQNYWPSLKICLRNNYQIPEPSLWCDYMDLLRFFSKDLYNPKHVCPNDLKAEHDRYVRKKRTWQERTEREQAAKQLQKDTACFNETKSRFFGIRFSDGLIEVRMLESVEEIKQEGDAMHSCVFTNGYHLKPDSLILSACMDNHRLETVEFSLSDFKVRQSSGLCNQITPYHDRIIHLVNSSSQHFKKRITAA